MSASKKILIVDDEVDLMEMISFIFKTRGFDVQTARDGQEALEKARVFSPDLIILDVNMPGMGGVEFYSRICGPDGEPLYAVLLLTAQASLMGKLSSLKIKGFMVKPFDAEELVAKAQQILQQKPQVTKKIFIADDDQDMVYILKTSLEKSGYKVQSAADGLLALKALKEYVPDIMILDLTMPHLSGWHLCMKIRQDPRYQTTPIIILSGLVGEETSAGEFDAHTSYMVKPFDIFKLTQRINDLTS
jgi:DNA-binding response OmpR family regulator